MPTNPNSAGSSDLTGSGLNGGSIAGIVLGLLALLLLLTLLGFFLFRKRKDQKKSALLRNSSTGFKSYSDLKAGGGMGTMRSVGNNSGPGFGSESNSTGSNLAGPFSSPSVLNPEILPVSSTSQVAGLNGFVGGFLSFPVVGFPTGSDDATFVVTSGGGGLPTQFPLPNPEASNLIVNNKSPSESNSNNFNPSAPSNLNSSSNELIGSMTYPTMYSETYPSNMIGNMIPLGSNVYSSSSSSSSSIPPPTPPHVPLPSIPTSNLPSLPIHPGNNVTRSSPPNTISHVLITSPNRPDVKFVYHEFTPTARDEVPLTPGESVMVLEVFADGWCRVFKESERQVGMVPGVCLEKGELM